MPEMESMCVIIPVHKPELTPDEVMSLQACKKHLQGYTTYLIFPEGMNIERYHSIHPWLVPRPVPPLWLSTIENYNRMKCSLSFYEIFKAYRFMLTYELDSYIFDSDLNKSSPFTFDYIGAPFYLGYLHAQPDAPFIEGCNSGFSIRNIGSCIQVLQTMKRFKPHWKWYKRVFSKFPSLVYHFNRLTRGRYDVYLSGKLGFYFSGTPMNEDLVWSQIVPFLFPSFKVADPISALKFSFEAQPKRLLLMNEGQLPIGCHGWIKNQDFWKDYIDIKQSL